MGPFQTIDDVISLLLRRRWLILAVTVLGVALSLFLGFRNNAAYDRWWEARKLWGGLLADMRSLAREVEVFLADPSTPGGGAWQSCGCSAKPPVAARWRKA